MRLSVARGRVALASSFAFAAFAALGTLAACSAKPAEPAAAAAPMGSEHHHEKNLPPVGPQVRVVLEGKSADVTVADLPHDGPTVPLTQLWKAAMPSDDAATLHFDMIGSDGFHIGSRPACARLLTGAEIAQARIDVTSHDVTFADGVELPGCYKVRAVVRIQATR